MDENNTTSTQAPKSNMSMILIAVVLLLLVGGGLYIFSQQKNTTSQTPATQNQQGAAPTSMEPSGTPAVTETTGDAMTASTKEITVTGQNFSFTPSTITVKKGDKVKLTFKNAGGVHDFTIDELGVKTKQIPGGQSDTVEFIADKAGTFEYYCSVGNHRQLGMKGTLTVE